MAKEGRDTYGKAGRRAQHTRPAKAKAVRLGDIEDQLETGRFTTFTRCSSGSELIRIVRN